MSFGLFKRVAKFFQQNIPSLRRVQSSSVDETWCNQKVHDLTGQLFNIPQLPVTSGGYGDIWKCDWIKDGTVVKVAAKVIRRQDATNDNVLRQALKRYKRELAVCMRLRHDRILPLYGVADDFLPGTSVMVFPWLQNGTITNFITSRHGLSLRHRLQLISDVADGLRYLHSKSIVHGDLTGSNILVCAKERAHIADFGLSMMLTEHNTASHSVTGAARWAAPELITGPSDTPDLLSFQSDMYSFGSIMFHILSGIIPYHTLSHNQVLMAIMRGEKPSRPDEPRISDRHWNFIQLCWLPFEDRFLRPSADEACDLLQGELEQYI